MDPAFLLGLALGAVPVAIIGLTIWGYRRNDRVVHAQLGLPVTLMDGERYFLKPVSECRRANLRVIYGGLSDHSGSAA
jgi:hypothetical protein